MTTQSNSAETPPENRKVIDLNLIGQHILTTAFAALIGTVTWNYALVPMISSAPSIHLGNVFVILLSFRMVVLLIFGDIISLLRENLLFYRMAAEIINTNMTSQGSAIIKLLNLINQKPPTNTDKSVVNNTDSEVK